MFTVLVGAAGTEALTAVVRIGANVHALTDDIASWALDTRVLLRATTLTQAIRAAVAEGVTGTAVTGGFVEVDAPDDAVAL